MKRGCTSQAHEGILSLVHVSIPTKQQVSLQVPYQSLWELRSVPGGVTKGRQCSWEKTFLEKMISEMTL